MAMKVNNRLQDLVYEEYILVMEYVTGNNTKTLSTEPQLLFEDNMPGMMSYTFEPEKKSDEDAFWAVMAILIIVVPTVCFAIGLRCGFNKNVV